MPTATPTPEKSTVTEEFRRVPIDQIQLGPNVRLVEGDVRELADSIKAVGILQPLIVTPLPKDHVYPGDVHYLLVAGYRRMKAARLAGLTEVPVMVRTFSDPERLEAQLIAASTAELEAAKVKNVGMVRHWGSQLKGDAMRLGQAYNEVNVRRDVHEKLPCHVAGIDEETGEIVYGCSKPASHAAKAGAEKLSKKELEHRAEVRTENKLRKDAKDQRTEFTASLVKKATAARAATQFTLRMLIDRMGSTEIKPAAQLLGLQPVKHKYGESYSEPLEALADKGDSDLYRVALAIAIAMGEGTFSLGFSSLDERKIKYLTFLKDQGYKLTPWEKEQLQAAKDELAKDRKDR